MKVKTEDAIYKIKYGIYRHTKETIQKCSELLVNESKNINILSMTEENIKDINQIKYAIEQLKNINSIFKTNEKVDIKINDETDYEYSTSIEFNNMSIFNKGD